MRCEILKKNIVYWWIKSLKDLMVVIKNKDLFHLKCKIVNHGVINVDKCIIGGVIRSS